MTRLAVFAACLVALAAPAHAARGGCATALHSGDILDGDRTLGLASDPLNRSEGHTLEVENRSCGDAIVKLRDAASGRLVVAFLVRGNDAARISGLSDGAYTLQFATGDYLTRDCRAFAHPRGVSQFRGTERLVSHAAGYTVETTFLRYALYGGSGGRLRAVPIDLAAFNAP